MGQHDTREIVFETLNSFLDTGHKILGEKRLFYRFDEPPTVGSRIVLIVTVKEVNEAASCLVTVQSNRRDGTRLQVLKWDKDGQARLWRLLAMGRGVMGATSTKAESAPSSDQPFSRSSSRNAAGTSSLPPPSVARRPGTKASRSSRRSAPRSSTEGPPATTNGAAPRPSTHRDSDTGEPAATADQLRIDSFTASLKTHPLPVLLKKLLVSHGTGRLDLASTELRTRIHVRDGNIVQLEEQGCSMHGFLLTAVRVLGYDTSGVERHQSAWERSGAPEAVLVNRRVLSPKQAERIMSRRTSLLLGRAIENGWQGNASFISRPTSEVHFEVEPDPSIPTARMLWDGLRVRAGKLTHNQIERFVKRLLEARLNWRPTAEFKFEDATRRTGEQDVIHGCRRDIESVVLSASENGSSARTTIIVLWILVRLGFITRKKSVDSTSWSSTPRTEIQNDALTPPPTDVLTPPPGEVPTPQDSAPTPPTAAYHGNASNTGGPTSPLGKNVLRNGQTPPPPVSDRHLDGAVSDEPLKELAMSLGDQVDRMAAQNHFEVLGLGLDATSSDVEEAFRNALTRYRWYVESVEPDLVGVGQAIIRRLFEAYEVLSNSRKRAYYKELIADSSA